MFTLVAKAIMVFQYNCYGEKQAIHQKTSVLSELKGNCTDNQAHSLMIGIPSTILIFKLSTIVT